MGGIRPTKPATSRINYLIDAARHCPFGYEGQRTPVASEARRVKIERFILFILAFYSFNS